MLVNLILSLYETSVILLVFLMFFSKTASQGRIGKYIMRYKLGTGSVGLVRLGVHEDTGTKFAVKIISKGKCSDNSRIDNEIKVCQTCVDLLTHQAMMMLEHPHVVKLEEVLESVSSVFFVMELCGGGSLYELMDNTALPEPMARFFYSQIISAVAYCHSQGL